MIQIKSKQDGFRRCGIEHSSEAVEYADDHFTAKELKILEAEPMLVVVHTNAKPESPDRPNAADSIKLVKAAETTEALDELTAGEDRKSVLAAIDAMREKLAGAKGLSPVQPETGA